MYPASRQYTLVGFRPELDWRPLTFLKPFRYNRVCSACGLVRRRTAWLPCMHVLCECCYEQCYQDGFNECPLDGDHCEKDEVALLDSTGDVLLRREVKCWNEDSGCQYATAASGITQHFLLECEHHSVRCPKCSATVLCRDVCTHLRSASCNTSTPVASESQVPVSQVDEAASLTSFKEPLERQAGEIAANLGPVAIDMSKHRDRLGEISHGINTLKETLRRELASLKEENHEEIMSSNAELKEYIGACSETFDTSLGFLEETLNDNLCAIRADLSQIAASIEQVKTSSKEGVQKSLPTDTNVHGESTQLTQCEFFVKGVESLKEEALKNFRADCTTKTMMLGRCRISPGVTFEYCMGTVMLRITLYMGDMDGHVQWSLQHMLRFIVIHPGGRANCVREGVTIPHHARFDKPTSSCEACYFNGGFSLEELIRDGYVDNDQLRIKLELLLKTRN